MAAITATVTTAGRNLFAAAAAGTDVCQITYVAVGTGNTTPNINDKKLVAESSVSGARKSIANSGTAAAGTNPGEVLINITLQAPDASNVAIQEIGFFGGKSATSTKDSGVLIARALYSHTKLPTEQLALSFDLTI